jgi:hypothetical protein
MIENFAFFDWPKAFDHVKKEIFPDVIIKVGERNFLGQNCTDEILVTLKNTNAACHISYDK